MKIYIDILVNKVLSSVSFKILRRLFHLLITWKHINIEKNNKYKALMVIRIYKFLREIFNFYII